MQRNCMLSMLRDNQAVYVPFPLSETSWPTPPKSKEIFKEENIVILMTGK